MTNTKPPQQNKQPSGLTRLLVLFGVLFLAPIKWIGRLLGFGHEEHEDWELEDHAVSDEAIERRHEVADIRVSPLLKFGVALIVIAGLLHLVLWGVHDLFRVLTATTVRSPLQATPVVPPRPNLQANPGADMREFREQEAQTLNSYGWVDQDQGVVRIPIEQAMKRIIEQGLPHEGDREWQPGYGNYTDLDSEGGQLIGTLTPVPIRPVGEVEASPTPEPTGTPQTGATASPEVTTTPQTGATASPEVTTTPTP